MAIRFLVVLLPMLLSPAGDAEGGKPGDPLVKEALIALRADDVRVATIAWRIAVGSADICSVVQPLSGMVVHDLGQYTDRFRDGAAQLFGGTRGIAIQGVVPGSPAALAALRPNDRLLAIGDTMLDPLPGDGDHMPMVRAAIDAAMAEGKARAVLLRDCRRIEVDLAGVKGCASRVEIRASADYNGWADGVTAQLSSAMVDFTRDDDELAVVVAHEMAHNILRHRERLDAAGGGPGRGRTAQRVRATEMEADRLAVYLVARAGFDPDAAARFWDRLLREHGPGILASGTHLGRRDQVAWVTGVARDIAVLRAAGQPLLPPLLGKPLPPFD